MFENMMLLQRGFPQKSGIPPDFVPISSRNVRSDTLIGTNDTCFVENFI